MFLSEPGPALLSPTYWLRLLGLLTLLCACATPQSAALPSPPSREASESIVRVRFVGDLMAHAAQLRAASRGGGRFEFRQVFEGVKPLLSDADLTFGNLETTLAGQDLYYSGYPTFNTPIDYAEALKWSGFDILQTANNHSRDRRFLGIERTLTHLEKLNLLAVGTFRTAEDALRPSRMVEVRGLKLAFLAYTFSTNGVPPEAGRSWSVSEIDPDKMASEIRQARELGADLVLVGLHWGDDYSHKPSDDQKALADRLISAGADALLGTHPHVLQPIEWVESGGRRALVAWSLGNFVSNQRQVPRATGLVMEIQFNAATGTRPSITGASLAPVWVDADEPTGQAGYRIRPLDAELPYCRDQQGRERYQLSEEDCAQMSAAKAQADPFLKPWPRLSATAPPPHAPTPRDPLWDEVLSDSSQLWPAPKNLDGRDGEDPKPRPLNSPVPIPGGMLLIPKATISLGSPTGQGDEAPRTVDIDSFAIDRNEVLASDYGEFLSSQPELPLPGAGISWAKSWAWSERTPPVEQADRPVVLVSQAEARAYCAWRGARLPTEDEWEYAARGPSAKVFPWGDRWCASCANWYDRPRQPGGARVDGASTWTEPGRYPEGRSPFGLNDMVGNVAEWVEHGREDDERGLLKGGSWFTNNPHWIRPAFRYFTDPTERSTIYGFRCARSLP